MKEEIIALIELIDNPKMLEFIRDLVLSMLKRYNYKTSNNKWSKL